MAYASYVRSWSQLPSGDESDDRCGMCSTVFSLGTELRRCLTCTCLVCADCCPVSCVVDTVIGVRHICKGCLPAHDIAEDIPAVEMPIHLRNNNLVEMLPTRGMPLRPSSRGTLPANLPKGTTLMRDVAFKVEKNRGDPRDPAQRKSDESVCTGCSVQFSIVEHRHRCGACQLPVCHGCARRSVRPAHDMLNPIRICDDCVHYHTEVLPTCPLFGPIPQISPAEVERLTEDKCFDRAERRAAAFAAANGGRCGGVAACCGDNDCSGGNEEVHVFDGDVDAATGINGEGVTETSAWSGSWASFPWRIVRRVMAAMGGDDFRGGKVGVSSSDAATMTTGPILRDCRSDDSSHNRADAAGDDDVFKCEARGHRRGGGGGGVGGSGRQWGSDLTAETGLSSSLSSTSLYSLGGSIGSSFRGGSSSFRVTYSSASLLTTAPPSPSAAGSPRSSPMWDASAAGGVTALPSVSEAGPLHLHVERIRLLKRELQREYDLAATAADNLSKEIFFEQKRVRERFLAQRAAAATRSEAGQGLTEPAGAAPELVAVPAALAAHREVAAVPEVSDRPAAASMAAADAGGESAAAAMAKIRRNSPWMVALAAAAMMAVVMTTIVACSGRGGFRICF